MPIGAFDVKPTPTGKVVVDFLNRRMPAYVDTGMNLVDVEDVAVGHILALERGKPGERYILGNRNTTFREMLGILEDLTGLPAPRSRLPMWVAFGAACADEFVEGRLLRRCPRVQVAAVRAAGKHRYHDCSKAVRELGMPQSPVENAFARAVDWFRLNGYAS
jgi:dihydroflavonol-4-reductase